MLDGLRQLVLNPSVVLAGAWPRGWSGVLLLFCLPMGVGVPPGVLLAQHDGLDVASTTALYVLSDVLMATVLFEPMLRLLVLASRRVPALERFGRTLLVATTRLLPADSIAGPTGVVLTGFGGGLPFGRALGAGMGYGLATSWLLTMAGDLLYFTLGMASTLWFQGLFGDPRTAVLAALAVMLIVPLALRRLRG